MRSKLAMGALALAIPAGVADVTGAEDAGGPARAAIEKANAAFESEFEQGRAASIEEGA